MHLQKEQERKSSYPVLPCDLPAACCSQRGILFGRLSNPEALASWTTGKTLVGVNIKGDFCYINRSRAVLCMISKEVTIWQETCSKKERKCCTKDLCVSPRAELCQDAFTTESSSLITQEKEHWFSFSCVAENDFTVIKNCLRFYHLLALVQAGCLKFTGMSQIQMYNPISWVVCSILQQ